MLKRLTHWDSLLSQKPWNLPRWLWWYLRMCSRVGDLWIWLLIGVAVAVGGSGPTSYRAIGSACLGELIAVTVFVVLKRSIRRRRPKGSEHWNWDSWSFPSGHATTAFTVCTAIGHYYPHAVWFLAGLSVSVGMSRVLLRYHYPSDVFAGALLGVLSGLAGVWLAG